MGTEGRLVAESYVRRDADQRWFPAGKIPGLLPTANASIAANPAATATVSPPPVPPPPAVSPRAEASGASDSSSKKLKLARPVAAMANAPAAEPPAPPPVAGGKSQSNGKPSPPIPAPAADASPLGIVVAPPVAGHGPSNRSGRSSKSGAHAIKSSLAAATEKDANGLSPLLVGGVLCGVAFVLVAIGGGVVAWQMSQKSAADAVAKAAAKPVETKPAISDAELDAILGPVTIPEPKRAAPTKRAEPAPAIAAADTAPAEVKPPADPKIEAARKLLAAQTRWSPVEGVIIKGRDIEVQIAQIWLATDEKGTRVDPVLPPSAPAAAGATASVLPPAATASASPGKYVFIDVRITNSGAIPRKYTSWNTGGIITAILADAKHEPLAFVPPADTPSVTRLASVHIPAGQTIGDVLVFQAPAAPFETLKLLLSQAAFATAGRNFALDVPVEFLFKRAEGLPPQTAIAADDAIPAEGEAQPPKKPVDPNAPPSLEEFTKQLENDKKMLDKRNATDSPANPQTKG